MARKISTTVYRIVSLERKGGRLLVLHKKLVNPIYISLPTFVTTQWTNYAFYFVAAISVHKLIKILKLMWSIYLAINKDAGIDS